MSVSNDELVQLRRDLDDHPDVAPDDRVRALAAVGFWKILSLIGAVLAFPLGFFVAGALMMFIDGGEVTATFCALFGTFLGMSLPTSIYLFGRGVQRRQLLRAMRRAQDRRAQAVLLSAGGGASSVAISSIVADRQVP